MFPSPVRGTVVSELTPNEPAAHKVENRALTHSNAPAVPSHSAPCKRFPSRPRPTGCPIPANHTPEDAPSTLPFARGGAPFEMLTPPIARGAAGAGRGRAVGPYAGVSGGSAVTWADHPVAEHFGVPATAAPTGRTG
ncbi:hypothetical protein GCM10010247_02370 [Streptomyces calvus]|nr:hypothetical protein GCM10010247_02370 [Streptomyces calvus]